MPQSVTSNYVWTRKPWLMSSKQARIWSCGFKVSLLAFVGLQAAHTYSNHLLVSEEGVHTQACFILCKNWSFFKMSKWFFWAECILLGGERCFSSDAIRFDRVLHFQDMFKSEGDNSFTPRNTNSVKNNSRWEGCIYRMIRGQHWPVWYPLD